MNDNNEQTQQAGPPQPASEKQAPASVEKPAEKQAAPPEPAPPAPQVPAPTPEELFKNDPEFRKKTLEMAGKLAQSMGTEWMKDARQAEQELYIQKNRKYAIENHLKGLEELAYLLPASADPAAMDNAAKNLRSKLKNHFALEMMGHLQTRRPPTAAQLILFGLANRMPLDEQHQARRVANAQSWDEYASWKLNRV